VDLPFFNFGIHIFQDSDCIEIEKTKCVACIGIISAIILTISKSWIISIYQYLGDIKFMEIILTRSLGSIKAD
jgi:hypothetical protein